MSELINEQQEMVTETNPLAAAVWGDEVPPATATVETAAEAVDATGKEKKEDVVVDTAEPLKQNLGYDDWETAKKEIEELRQLKEKPPTPAEIKFANEESEKLFKALQEGNEDVVFESLSRKREFERLQKLDITNTSDAEQIIKANLKLKYKDNGLSSAEIEDIFNEQYAKPAKPQQQIDQTDEEYEAVVKDWELRSESLDKRMIRDAKIAKTEVIQLQSQIVYPDIPTKENQGNAGLSQEDLAALDKAKNSLLTSAEAFMKSFNGFQATVKDKDVEIPVSYDLSKDEKTNLEKVVKDFAENGLDANTIFASRWLTEEGSINTERMIRDLALLMNGEKISQKYVNDAANKRLELYLKDKKNINVNGAVTSGSFDPNNAKTEMQAVQEWVWNT